MGLPFGFIGDCAHFTMRRHRRVDPPKLPPSRRRGENGTKEKRTTNRRGKTRQGEGGCEGGREKGFRCQGENWILLGETGAGQVGFELYCPPSASVEKSAPLYGRTNL